MTAINIDTSHSLIISEEVSDITANRFLFNNSNFLGSRTLPGPGRTLYFQLLERMKIRKASMHVVMLDEKGYSPWKAPFGSVECHESTDLKELSTFLKVLGRELIRRGISSLEVTNYPDFYAPDLDCDDLINKGFFSAGFTRRYTEVNQYLSVEKEPFIEKISYAQKKRINKCMRAEFRSGVDTLQSLPEAYAILERSRKAKAYPVTMKFGDLKDMFEKLPDHYLLFSVRDQGKMVALVISILVSEDIMYNFYHASDPEYHAFSPIVSAIQCVYEYAQEHSFKFIDLGISTKDGLINEGLYRFKKELGALKCNKNRYEWTAGSFVNDH